MSLTLAPEAPPLVQMPDGTVRVGQSRLSLEQLVDAFRRGDPLPELVEQYHALTLADIHGAVGYWLRHPAEVDEYVARQDAKAAELRRRIEARLGPQPSRDELLARWHVRQGG